jgi:hypothetical protein
MRYVFLVLLLPLLSSCGTTCPRIQETRCNGQIVEVCGANNKWQRVLSCAQIQTTHSATSTKWTCVAAPPKHTCLPEVVK